MKDEDDEKDFAKYHAIVEEYNNKWLENLQKEKPTEQQRPSEHALRNPSATCHVPLMGRVGGW